MFRNTFASIALAFSICIGGSCPLCAKSPHPSSPLSTFPTGAILAAAPLESGPRQPALTAAPDDFHIPAPPATAGAIPATPLADSLQQPALTAAPDSLTGIVLSADDRLKSKVDSLRNILSDPSSRRHLSVQRLLEITDSLRLRYEFSTAEEILVQASKNPEYTRDTDATAQTKLITDALALVRNGLGMMENCFSPIVVSRQKFALDDFYLMYPMENGAWRKTPALPARVTGPASPASKTASSVFEPESPASEPASPTSKPENLASETASSVSELESPASKTANSVSEPENPASKTASPASKTASSVFEPKSPASGSEQIAGPGPLNTDSGTFGRSSIDPYAIADVMFVPDNTDAVYFSAPDSYGIWRINMSRLSSGQLSRPRPVAFLGLQPATAAPQPTAGLLPTAAAPQPAAGLLPTAATPQPAAGLLPTAAAPQSATAGLLPTTSLADMGKVAHANMIFPTLSPDGESLYFASDGLDGMGGYDLYVSKWNRESGGWGPAENMGFPYSSPYDDFLYIDTDDGQYSVFASNRECTPDSVHIYVLEYDATPLLHSVSNARELRRLSALAPSRSARIFRESEGRRLDVPDVNAYLIKVSEVRDLRDTIKLYNRQLDILRSQIADYSLDGYVSPDGHVNSPAEYVISPDGYVNSPAEYVISPDGQNIEISALEQAGQSAAIAQMSDIRDLERKLHEIKSRMEKANKELQDIELKFLADGVLMVPVRMREDQESEPVPASTVYEFIRHTLAASPLTAD